MLIEILLKSILILFLFHEFSVQNALGKPTLSSKNYLQWFLILSVNIEQNKVVYKSIQNDNTKSVVIMNKVEDLDFAEADDLFFEVESPKDISYTYRIRIGKIGSFFVNN